MKRFPSGELTNHKEAKCIIELGRIITISSRNSKCRGQDGCVASVEECLKSVLVRLAKI